MAAPPAPSFGRRHAVHWRGDRARADALMAITGKLGRFRVRAEPMEGLPELDASCALIRVTWAVTG
jgi:hypothetical protein